MAARIAAPARVRRCIIDAARAPVEIDWSEADEWRVLVTLDGVPCAELRIASPGNVTHGGIVSAAVLRYADARRAHERLLEDLQSAIGVSPRTYRRPTCSVVVCTHRRPARVAALLARLEDLDPPASEIIVVDNDPGDEDCEQFVIGTGAAYIREDRRGLNNARIAGVRASSGELVAFTDDDCLPSIGWLGNVPELFDDPLVAAVTGPGLPYEVATRAQEIREQVASFAPRLHREKFDWTSLQPVYAGRVGAGMNMTFRRCVLEELEGIFALELDGGTETRSGGDIYALYRVLTAGYRITYDPGSYVFHRHDRDLSSLRRTIQGYGIGASAYLTKVLVEERDPGGVAVWWWLGKQYLRSLTGAFDRSIDRAHLQVSGEYLRGALLGPGAWRRARRASSAAGAAQPESARHDRAASGGGGAAVAVRADGGHPAASPDDAAPGRLPDAVTVSVVIAAHDAKPGEFSRCLEALAADNEVEGGVEAVVVGHGALPRRPESRVPGLVVTETRALEPREVVAWNAGAKVASGDTLVFLDGSLVPDLGLAARHATHHLQHEGEHVVFGRCHTTPATGSLAELVAVAAQEDHYRRMDHAVILSANDAAATNLSLSRQTFERLGGFDPSFEGTLGASADLAQRATDAGVELAYEPSARATRRLRATTAEELQRAFRVGRDEALLRVRHPTLWRGGRRPGSTARAVARIVAMVGDDATGIEPLARGLDLLERMRARGNWLLAFNVAADAARAAGGLRAGQHPRAAWSSPVAVSVAPPSPLPRRRAVPAPVDLYVAGEKITRIEPEGGQWSGAIVDQAMTAFARAWWDETRGRWWRNLPYPVAHAFEETPEGRDLRGIAVLLGEGAGSVEAFESAGARVERVAGEGPEFWRNVDRAVGSASEEFVLVTLPGVTATPEWAASAAIGLDGDRVAAVLGAGLPPGCPPEPLVLHSRATLTGPYARAGWPTQFLALRRSHYMTLGRLEADLARLGPYGPILELVERILERGFVLGIRDTPGLDPAGSRRPARTANIWLQSSAFGGLMAARAASIGAPRGFGWFARRTLVPFVRQPPAVRRGRTPSIRYWAGALAATLWGGLKETMRR
jgi:GT2 family glycosyltransferase